MVAERLISSRKTCCRSVIRTLAALPDMFDLPVPQTKKIRKQGGLGNTNHSSNTECRIHI
jgi:hypothetical protein